MFPVSFPPHQYQFLDLPEVAVNPVQSVPEGIEDDIFGLAMWLQEQEDAKLACGQGLHNAKQIWSREALRSRNFRDALAAYFSELGAAEQDHLYLIPQYAQLAKALRSRWPSRGKGSAKRKPLNRCLMNGGQKLGVMIQIVENSRHNPYSLLRCGEFADPAYVLHDERGCAVKPLVGGPEFAAKDVCQCEIVRVIDRPLAELTRELQRPHVKIRNVAQFDSRSKKVPQKSYRVLY